MNVYLYDIRLNEFNAYDGFQPRASIKTITSNIEGIVFICVYKFHQTTSDLSVLSMLRGSRLFLRFSCSS